MQRTQEQLSLGGAVLESLHTGSSPRSQVFKGERDPPGGKAELVGNIPGIPGVCSPEPANNTAAFVFLNGFRTKSGEITYVQTY